MTPLYDAIRAFSAQGPVRLHIPGHKGVRAARGGVFHLRPKACNSRQAAGR